MMQIQTLLMQAKNQLSKLDLTQTEIHLEAEILLAHTLNQSRIFLHASPNHLVTEQIVTQFAEVLQRRLNKEPIAYIIGKKEFWSLDIHVNRDTLIPRPETELLIEKILAIILPNETATIADLGTGNGAIALALAHEKPNWQIHATDLHETALQIAMQNAKSLKLQNICFHQGNWCEALPQTTFDLIVSNPPYIAEKEWQDYAQDLSFEPRYALVSGTDGLKAIREICQSAPKYLKVGGYLLLEHGFSQGQAVRNLMELEGYYAIHSFIDLNRKERVTMGRYFPS